MQDITIVSVKSEIASGLGTIVCKIAPVVSKTVPAVSKIIQVVQLTTGEGQHTSRSSNRSDFL